ncbi:MAG: glycoside hydrolase family 68 protein [Psychrobacillus sp.]
MTKENDEKHFNRLGEHEHRSNKNRYKLTSQQFPVRSSRTESVNLMPSASVNRNSPSGATGNNNVRYRTFNGKQISQFCNYNPRRDFGRCLEYNRDAIPSVWTRSQVEQIRINSTNVAPLIEAPFPRISADLWIWDMWPLIEKDGSIAVLPGGWRVLFALSVPRSVLPGKRHDVARISYFYSRLGLDWIQGGYVFEEGTALGSRQWAGSAMLDDDGRIYYFYTATGRRGEAQITYEQRIALSSSDYISNLDGVQLVNFSPHQVILEPDGILYQTEEQSSGGIIYAFRDPFFFKDPATGCEYLLFEGNIAGTSADVDCGPGVPADAAEYTGNIGIALLRNNSFSSWELLPALLEAGCTNQQTERPHIVVSDGLYYLFTDTHASTFAPGLVGPDGLYGFVAGSLRGNYVPLNGSGLVVSNPPSEPFQAYSWLVLPDFSVLSFIDNFDLQGIPIEEVGFLPEQFQFEHFGGTLAQTLQLAVSGRNTEIIDVYEYGLMMVSETESPKCRECNDDYSSENHHRR